MTKKDQLGHCCGIVNYQFSDLSKDLQLYYYKTGESFSLEYKIDTESIIIPLCHSNFTLKTVDNESRPDVYSVELIAKNKLVKLNNIGSFSHFAILVPTPALLKRTSKLHSVDLQLIQQVFEKSKSIPRNNWLNEIIHRYIFEINSNNSSNKNAISFLETEIIKQLYYNSCNSNSLVQNRFSLEYYNLDKKSDLIKKALLFIETNLFYEIDLSILVENIHASSSTIKRAFKAELNCSPASYIRDRRLDEAYVMIKGQRKQISEVYHIVGYESVSSFSLAYKKKFGVRPSESI